ncbi:MAG: GAF domain-containing protein [Chloroflexi bacterium]|nr:GAF domain-containing protein [Chloroflexota bacterium]
MALKNELSQPETLPALREIARALSAAWDLDSTLDLIARKTTEVMYVDSCTIYLLDSDGQTLRLRASTGLAKRAWGRTTLQVGEGMTGYAAQRKKPIHAENAQDDPHFKWVVEAEEKAFQSLLAVPLIIESQPDSIGAMNVQTKQLHQFSESEIERLSLIADLAAGALAKARLLDKQKQQIDEMQALATLSEVMTSPQYLDDILNVVTEMAAQTMDAAVCSLFLINETGTHLELRSAKRATTPYRHRDPLPIGTGIIGEVVNSGRTIYIRDVRKDPNYLGAELAMTEGLVSLLSVPLSVRDHVIGVLNCYTDKPRVFSEEQFVLFNTLANQTALAIENSRLVTNTAVIREMHHRIKNNLQTVAMLMQLQIPDADRLDTRQVLETNIHRIRSIAAVHEVLSDQGFRLVDVKDVLERITHTTVETMTSPKQSIEIDVYGDPMLLPSRAATALTMVVNELVQNALEHAFVEGGNGRIEISLGRSTEELIVLVRDSGTGFAPDYKRGLGLEIAETLVAEDLRGKIKFNQPTNGGTEISIRMSRAIEQAVE